jgi:hypothetical protein
LLSFLQAWYLYELDIANAILDILGRGPPMPPLGVAMRHPRRPLGVARGHPLLPVFLFSCFKKSIFIYFLINLYFFIKMDTWR